MENVSALDQIRIKAYKEVQKASSWILELAKKQHYYDEYTKRLDASAQKFVMPIAEMLMCLTNCLEEKYQYLGLPLADKALLTKITTDLIEAIDAHGFSGRPYLVPTDISIKKDPSFTDAVTFTVGALVNVMKANILDENMVSKCEDLLIDCIDWLLEAKIAFPKGSPFNGCGWSWTSPAEMAGNPELTKFKHYLPPQTYFTSNVMISLCEALFDRFKLLEDKQKTKGVLECIVEAKKFFLTTLFADLVDTNKGWTDYRVGFSEMKPYEEDIEQASWVFSSYGLEPLTYIRYYFSKYGEVVSTLQKNYPDLFEQFQHFSNDDIKKLNQIFVQCINEAKRPKVFRRSCTIQVPNQFNQYENGKSYYIDGTVGYNLLNTINFYLDYFPRDKEAEKEWRNAEFKLAKTLIENSFKENAFTHCSTKESIEAIYATRTAIATFLSWGLMPPKRPMQEEISTEIKDQIAKLYNMVFGVPSDKKAAQTNINIEKDVINKLLQIGYIIGVSAAYLYKNVDIKNNPWFVMLFDPNDKITSRDVMQSNGKEMLHVFTEIINGTREDVTKEIEAIFKLKCLTLEYKEFIKNMQSGSEFSIDIKARIETLLKIADNVKGIFHQSSEKDYVGDLVNDCIQ